MGALRAVGALALSLLALVVAAGLPLAHRLTWPRAVGVLGALALWLTMRDSHAVVAAAGGATIVLGAAVSWVRARRRSAGEPRRRGPLVALGVGALVLAAMVGWAASHGDRHAFPVRNVYEVRVLPYADRVQWFADHGMPQADQFTGPSARPPYLEEGLPPVVYVADDDPTLGEWLDWVESDGRVAFARYVATHPTYLVTEPLRSPERRRWPSPCPTAWWLAQRWHGDGAAPGRARPPAAPRSSAHGPGTGARAHHAGR